MSVLRFTLATAALVAQVSALSLPTLEKRYDMGSCNNQVS